MACLQQLSSSRDVVEFFDCAIFYFMQTPAFLTLLSLFAMALLSPPTYAQVGDKTLSAIDRIYAEDQQAREGPNPHAPNPVYKSDDERESATRQLLEKGELQSGKDFEEAAIIFQHSHESDDYLLAHTLALIAVSKGNKDAVWIAAATLDRYLMSIDRPQIYGTQFMTPVGKHASQEPYNRTLVSDELRKELGIPSLADRREQASVNQNAPPGLNFPIISQI